MDDIASYNLAPPLSTAIRQPWMERAGRQNAKPSTIATIRNDWHIHPSQLPAPADSSAVVLEDKMIITSRVNTVSTNPSYYGLHDYEHTMGISRDNFLEDVDKIRSERAKTLGARHEFQNAATSWTAQPLRITPKRADFDKIGGYTILDLSRVIKYQLPGDIARQLIIPYYYTAETKQIQQKLAITPIETLTTDAHCKNHFELELAHGSLGERPPCFDPEVVALTKGTVDTAFIISPDLIYTFARSFKQEGGLGISSVDDAWREGAHLMKTQNDRLLLFIVKLEEKKLYENLSPHHFDTSINYLVRDCVEAKSIEDALRYAQKKVPLATSKLAQELKKEGLYFGSAYSPSAAPGL